MTNTDHESVAPEQELCISCLQPNPPGIHFCNHCQTPLTSYAATGPIEKVFAWGDCLRKAVVHPRRVVRWTGLVLTIGVIAFHVMGILLL